MFCPILDRLQFTQADVETVSGLAWTQIKGMIDTKKVQLRDEQHPGRGKRRMFSGGDVIRFTVAKLATDLGFPFSLVWSLGAQVTIRAEEKVLGIQIHPCKHFALATYPNQAGTDWNVTPVMDGDPAGPLPVAFQMFDVDKIIDQTLAKLAAILEGDTVPDFSIPDPVFEYPNSPEVNFFKQWTKDASGNDCYHGLTFDETAELKRLQDLRTEDEMQTPDAKGATKILYTDFHQARFEALSDKHRQQMTKNNIEFYRENPHKIIGDDDAQ